MPNRCGCLFCYCAREAEPGEPLCAKCRAECGREDEGEPDLR